MKHFLMQPKLFKIYQQENLQETAFFLKIENEFMKNIITQTNEGLKRENIEILQIKKYTNILVLP